MKLWISFLIMLSSPAAPPSDKSTIDDDLVTLISDQLELMRFGPPTQTCKTEPQANLSELLPALGIRAKAGKCTRSVQDLIDLDPTATDPTAAADWYCHSFLMALESDLTYGDCVPSAKSTFESPPKKQTISGYNRYVSGVRKKYAYDLELKEDRPLITVKLFFKGEHAQTEEGKTALNRRLQEAERLWNQQSPGKKIQFSFKWVTNPQDAHFTPTYVNGPTRGPYDIAWSSAFNSHGIAHELGHMMGLVDEYDQLGWTFKTLFKSTAKLDPMERAELHRCSITSMMCEEHDGKIQPQHYYWILRRALCSPVSLWDRG